MNVRVKLSGIALLSALAALALPGAALAEYYVPPGNSAANQYTETLPSAGGDSAGKGKGVTPAQALGAKNAHKLEAEGPAGKAAAELAAETAPVIVEPSAGDNSDNGGANNGGNGSGQGSGNVANGNTGGGQAGEPVVTPQTTTATPVSSSSGSSGLGSVLGQATGVSDDGSLGLWLPLIIIATIAGTLAYRLRLRHGPTA
jgi:hypothetical protein